MSMSENNAYSRIRTFQPIADRGSPRYKLTVVVRADFDATGDLIDWRLRLGSAEVLSREERDIFMRMLAGEPLRLGVAPARLVMLNDDCLQIWVDQYVWHFTDRHLDAVANGIEQALGSMVLEVRQHIERAKPAG